MKLLVRKIRLSNPRDFDAKRGETQDHIRRRKVIDWLSPMDMAVANTGIESTFQKQESSFITDLIFDTANIRTKVQELLSDHRDIM